MVFGVSYFQPYKCEGIVILHSPRQRVNQIPPYLQNEERTQGPSVLLHPVLKTKLDSKARSQ